jgi:ferric-dicitrate binding protein FerR (iron transport regulator)
VGDFGAVHEPRARLLVRAADGLEAALANALGVWKTDGSVVLVHGDVELTEKLLTAERIHGK